MHRALLTDDITLKIVSLLSLKQSRVLALTCKAVLEPCLDRIWYHLPHLSHLMVLLPKDAYHLGWSDWSTDDGLQTEPDEDQDCYVMVWKCQRCTLPPRPCPDTGSKSDNHPKAAAKRLGPRQILRPPGPLLRLVQL